MKALAFARHAVSQGVAELTLDQPGLPINKLSNEVWEGLDEALTLWGADESVRAVVIASAKPGVFVAGADITELRLLTTREAARASSERAQRVFGRLEALGKPVVCAVNGVALGGGMELTLAAHAVVAAATPKSKVGLPETKLGLLPGAGGTQRLARRIGPLAAGRLIVAGDPIDAAAARDLGLVREVVPPADLAAAARGVALRLAEQGGFAPRWDARADGDPVIGYLAALQTLALPDPRFEAWAAALAAVYFGAARPFDAGLRLESEAFADLAVGAAARGLIERFLRGERL
jgi:3-hydroxyacyl-CoA dehydrogenase/enoyl-CoA hydratase/3-hydroxybutyryl-CoA epimerase